MKLALLGRSGPSRVALIAEPSHTSSHDLHMTLHQLLLGLDRVLCSAAGRTYVIVVVGNSVGSLEFITLQT